MLVDMAMVPEVQPCWPQTSLPLPAELLYKIFTRLDFTTQVGCQRVCKAWNRLLRDPQVLVWDRVYVWITALSKLRADAHLYPAAFAPITRFCTASRNVKLACL